MERKYTGPNYSHEWHQAHRRELNAELREKCRAICKDVRKMMRLRAANQAILVEIPKAQGPSFRDWRQSLKANRLQHKRLGVPPAKGKK